MNNSKFKMTALAIIALILICGGSFAGVKILNSMPANNTSVVGTDSAYVPSTDTITTVNSSPVSEQSTLPPATVAPENTPNNPDAIASSDGENNGENNGENSETDDTNKYTTFAVSSSADETKETTEASTTKATENTETTTEITTKKISNDATSSTKNPNDIVIENEEDARELIESAAVFSDGFLGYKYDADGNYFYTSRDPWQRALGFNRAYDMGAPFLVFYYDTMRVKFNYKGMDWLVQFWKGQYGWVFIGAEIGTYYKPADRSVPHYDCVPDEDTIKMSMTFYRKGVEKATREYANYWWCTAFVPGKLDKFSDRSELEMRARLTMKDKVMLLGFVNSLKQNGLKFEEDFTVDGLDVYVIY